MGKRGILGYSTLRVEREGGLDEWVIDRRVMNE
jgi:hypothetical protein